MSNPKIMVEVPLDREHIDGLTAAIDAEFKYFPLEVEALLIGLMMYHPQQIKWLHHAGVALREVIAEGATFSPNGGLKLTPQQLENINELSDKLLDNNIVVSLSVQD